MRLVIILIVIGGFLYYIETSTKNKARQKAEKKMQYMKLANNIYGKNSTLEKMKPAQLIRYVEENKHTNPELASDTLYIKEMNALNQSLKDVADYFKTGGMLNLAYIESIISRFLGVNSSIDNFILDINNYFEEVKIDEFENWQVWIESFNDSYINDIISIPHEKVIVFIDEWYKNKQKGDSLYSNGDYIQAVEYYMMKYADKDIFDFDKVAWAFWYIALNKEVDKNTFDKALKMLEYYYSFYIKADFNLDNYKDNYQAYKETNEYISNHKKLFNTDKSILIKSCDSILGRLLVCQKFNLNINEINRDIINLFNLHFANKSELKFSSFGEYMITTLLFGFDYTEAEEQKNILLNKINEVGGVIDCETNKRLYYSNGEWT